MGLPAGPPEGRSFFAHWAAHAGLTMPAQPANIASLFMPHAVLVQAACYSPQSGHKGWEKGILHPLPSRACCTRSDAGLMIPYWGMAVMPCSFPPKVMRDGACERGRKQTLLRLFLLQLLIGDHQHASSTQRVLRDGGVKPTSVRTGSRVTFGRPCVGSSSSLSSAASLSHFE